MSKFKVGDKVRILDGSKINNYFDLWSYDMKKHVGKVCTIDEVFNYYFGTGYCMKEIGYVWDERGLERIEDKPKNQKIVITHDGKTTTAKLYNGKKVMKTANAKCSPNDEFDFNIGAAIALERLTGCAYGHLESTLDSDLQWNRFMTNKIGLKVPTEKIEKFLKKCDEHGLRWFSGDRPINWNPLKKSRDTFVAYVYMYNDGDGLAYCLRQFDDKTCEVWEDDSFDWDGFKAGKFNVITTCDSVDRFLEECDAHQISYFDQKATEFNPIKDLEKLSPFVKAMILAMLDPDSTDECEFEVKDGDLVYSFKSEIKESTVRYD